MQWCIPTDKTCFRPACCNVFHSMLDQVCVPVKLVVRPYHTILHIIVPVQYTKLAKLLYLGTASLAQIYFLVLTIECR